MTDSLYVSTVTSSLVSLFSNYNVVYAIATIIAGIIAYVGGLIKIPKSIMIKLVEYVSFIVVGIVEAQKKADAGVPVGTKKIAMTGFDKLTTAYNIADTAINKSPNSKFFKKITKIFGGLANVIEIALPIVKPFIKRK